MNADTATLSTRFNNVINLANTKLKISDTSYLLLKKDTITLSNRIDALNADTLYLSNKIKSILASTNGAIDNLNADQSIINNALIADTAYLALTKLNKKDTITLSNRIDALNADTLYLANRINAILASTNLVIDNSNASQNEINKALIADTSTLIARFDQKFNTADTSFLLQKKDTISLSNRIEALNADTATLIARFDQKFNTSDTSFLLQKKDTITLSNRIDALNADTSTLIARFDQKLNFADTTLMLTNRIKRDTSFLLQKKDTITLSNRIEALNKDTATLSTRFGLKLNISDTAFLLQKRDTIALSNRINALVADTLSLASRILSNSISIIDLTSKMVVLNNTDLNLQSQIDNKIDKKDTNAIFSPFRDNINALILDTTTFADRLNKKVNYSDTANMLNAYRTKINSLIADTIYQSGINTTQGNLINSLIADSSTLVERFNLKLNISDTANMLKSYSDKINALILDTVSLASRITNSTNTLLSTYLMKADTITLSNRINALNKDTATLIGRFALKLNASDTSSMLNNYRNAINSLIADTVSLASRIGTSVSVINGIVADTARLNATKLNVTDTANMLSSYKNNISSLIADTVVLAAKINTKQDLIQEVSDETIASANQSGTTQTFNLTQIPSSRSIVKMYINGVRISNKSYSVSVINNIATLTYTSGLNGDNTITAGDRIQFDYFY